MTDSPTADPILTYRETEQHTGMKWRSLMKLCAEGRGPARLVYGPRCTRFRLSDLLKWRDSHLTRGEG